MKLRDGFITYSTDEEQIMVAAGSAAEHFHGMVRSNRTASFVIDCLAQETSKEEIVNQMLEKYDASREQAVAGVDRVLDALRTIGALDE